MLMFLAFVPGCSDYALNGKHKEPGDPWEEPAEHTDTVPAPPPPDIYATPDSVVTAGFCETDRSLVTVRSVGDAPLTITALNLVGTGWTMEAPPLPLVLAPTEEVTIPVTSTGGDATLEIVSDDPDEPLVAIPLSGIRNQPPTVTLVDPATGTVVAERDTLTLRGLVSDDSDPPEALGIAWTASVDGLLGTDPAAPDGTTTHVWPASQRSLGEQGVTLTATDSCGVPAQAVTALCQDATQTYDALDLAGWHFEGEARYDATDGVLVLTEADRDVHGTAFETSTLVSADAVTIDFLFYIGEGSGADGISLTALDTTRMTTFLGGTGCGIGYGGGADCTGGPALPGWSIEVDTWYNRDVDATQADHLAFSFDGNIAAPEVWVELPEMEDTGWHSMVVQVAAPHVTVAIDEVTYIDQDIEGTWDFPAYIGFTAGTGTFTNRHVIDALQVTDQLCD